MLMAAKVPACAQLALKSIEEGMAVVIGLQSTGEANTNALLEKESDDLNDLVRGGRAGVREAGKGGRVGVGGKGMRWSSSPWHESTLLEQLLPVRMPSLYCVGQVVGFWRSGQHRCRKCDWRPWSTPGKHHACKF
jgi:hypothetical protein